MAQRKNEDAYIELECINERCVHFMDEDNLWECDGRFNADGEFEPHDILDLECPNCGIYGQPTDDDTKLAQVI